MSEKAKGNRQLAGNLFIGFSAGWEFRNLSKDEREALPLSTQILYCNILDLIGGNCTTRRLEPDVAYDRSNKIVSNAKIRTNPIFKHFLDKKLLSSDKSVGSASAKTGLAHIVSYDIPALSHAAGGTEITNPQLLVGKKVDMNTAFKRDGWPSQHKDPETNEPAWYHSDFKDVAYLYTSKLYDDLVREGGLK